MLRSGNPFVDSFQQLMQTIVSRRDQPAERSYTQKLLSGGVPAIAEKIFEEAHEVVEAANEFQASQTSAALAVPASTEEQAAVSDARQHLVHEAADLIYHLWVLLASQRIELSEVHAELDRRSGVSGLDEKSSRSNPAC